MFHDSDPAALLVLKKNYRTACYNIQSFGALVSRAVPADKKNVFKQQLELQAFPLFPLIEWHLQGDTCDPNLNMDRADYWQALTEMLAEPLG